MLTYFTEKFHPGGFLDGFTISFSIFTIVFISLKLFVYTVTNKTVQSLRGFIPRNCAIHETFNVPESLFGVLVPERYWKGETGTERVGKTFLILFEGDLKSVNSFKERFSLR